MTEPVIGSAADFQREAQYNRDQATIQNRFAIAFESIGVLTTVLAIEATTRESYGVAVTCLFGALTALTLARESVFDKWDCVENATRYDTLAKEPRQ